MDRGNEYYNAWMKAQEKYIESWMDAVGKVPAFWREVSGESGSAQAGDGFHATYRKWMNDFAGTLSSFGGMSPGILKETFARLTGSSNIFMKLYEIWLPLAGAVQARATDAGAYREVFDPDKYKEVLDKVFGFSPEAAQTMITEAAKVAEALGVSVAEFSAPWAEAVRENIKLMPDFVEGRPETLLHVFHNLFQAFDDTIGKVYHIPPVGKDREKIELIMRGFDDLAVFMAKNTEYQNTVYIIGLRAMEKVFSAMAEKIKKGEDIKSFNEFFDLWSDINEREYHDLFRTPEFAKVQNAVLQSSLKVRGHFYKLMELYLFDFPVALRSEMDDLYRTVYELRKKVKSLEGQLNETTAKEAAA